jgi:serine/threonine protein kinase
MPTTLADFDIKRPLGKGSFGEVCKVTRKSDGQDYAIKRVDVSSADQELIEQTLNEVRFLASIRHPNVVGFLEAFLNKKQNRGYELCIVMEYAGGGDLSHKVERCRKRHSLVGENEIWDIFIQLCEGIHCLHSKGVIHRDLKAANCFIDARGIVKLGDLNVSRRLKTGDLARTQVGTPYYISPEIFRKKAYTFSSDIWSLGCILYELAALEPPFNGRDIDELSKRVQQAKFARISSKYSSDLSMLIAMLLKPNPKHRPRIQDILRLPCVTNWRAIIHEEQKEKEKEPPQTGRSGGGGSGGGAGNSDTKFSRASLFSAYSSAYTDTNRESDRCEHENWRLPNNRTSPPPPFHLPFCCAVVIAPMPVCTATRARAATPDPSKSLPSTFASTTLHPCCRRSKQRAICETATTGANCQIVFQPHATRRTGRSRPRRGLSRKRPSRCHRVLTQETTQETQNPLLAGAFAVWITTGRCLLSVQMRVND